MYCERVEEESFVLNETNYKRLKFFKDLILPHIIMSQLLNTSNKVSFDHNVVHSYTERSRYSPHSKVSYCGVDTYINNTTFELIMNVKTGDIRLFVNGNPKYRNKEFQEFIKNINEEEDMILHYDNWTFEVFFLNNKHDNLIIDIIKLYFKTMGL